MSKRSVLLLLFAVLLVFWCRSRREGFTQDYEPEDTILVSCAAFRDTECLKTIVDLFEKAEHPERVFVGVCQQNKCARESCTAFPPGFKWAQHVRTKDMKHTEARGPTLARYWCSTLHRGEKYYLQIDSHSLFLQNWDSKLVSMSKAAVQKHRNPKIVLSNYPSAIPDDRYPESKVNGAAGVPVLCRSSFNDNGMLSFESVIEQPKGQRVPFVSGGMLFAPATVLSDVPFDPNLPDLFQGEEILYSARLYTHGYDVYTPLENVVFHHYVREDSPKFWKDRPNYRKTQLQSIARVKMLLGFPMDHTTAIMPQKLTTLLANESFAPESGPGVTRRLKDYWSFAGIDPAARTSRSAALFCGT